MERFTEKLPDGRNILLLLNAYIGGVREIDGGRTVQFISGEPIDKLAIYEDIQDIIRIAYNREPPVMDGIKDMLKKIIDDSHGEKLEYIILSGDDVKRWEDYNDAEEQGLLVRLPCKLGDVTYWISDEDDDGSEALTIKENKPITGISVRKDGVYISTNDFELGALCKIGSRWALLTREDAEKKLKEMEELKC